MPAMPALTRRRLLAGAAATAACAAMPAAAIGGDGSGCTFVRSDGRFPDDVLGPSAVFGRDVTQ